MILTRDAITFSHVPKRRKKKLSKDLFRRFSQFNGILQEKFAENKINNGECGIVG